MNEVLNDIHTTTNDYPKNTARKPLKIYNVV